MKTLNKLFILIQNRFVQHSLFWILSFYVLLRIFAYNSVLTKTNIIYTIAFHVSLFLLVYVNLYVLIPKYLRKNKYLLYLILSILWILFVTAFNVWTFEYFIDYIFRGYYFISYYEFVDILQFIVSYFLISTLFKLSKGWFKLKSTERQLNILKEQKMSVELEALKAKVNPHFLLNSLNSIYSLSLDDDKEKLSNAIMKLSSSMKYVLYDTEIEKVRLAKEIKYLTDYIELQKMRMDYPEQIEFNLNGQIKDQMISPFMLIPIIENAFKHGLKGNKEDNYIKISIQAEEDLVSLKVANNKTQALRSGPIEQGGFGITNLKKRLNIEYPNQHRFEIVEDFSNYETKLELKLK